MSRFISATCRSGFSLESLKLRFAAKAAPTFLFVLFCFLFPASSFCLSAPPNIVFIMADDLGYGDVGCYGNSQNNTPNIDALAAGGLRFTDFHSSGPMCSPTRAGTMTGVYQQRFGPNFDGAISGVEDFNTGLPLEALTIAEVLRANGYATGCFGKWHLGFQPPYFPTKQGFDEFRGLGSGDGDFFTHVDRSGREDWWLNDDKAPEEGYTTELLTRHSIDFIKRHKEEPFFLYVPHLAIHFPWQGPDDPPHRQPGTEYHNDKWGVIPDRSNVHPHSKAMIEALDKSVGEIMGALKKEGLLENTLVVFTSDNGGYINYSGGFQNISSNGPLRGQKAQVYEGGHRVPAIVSWPNKIKAGVSSQTTHSTDWFPTFAKLAGISISNIQLDGLDLAPLLFEGKALEDRRLFWRIRGNWAIRSGPWKLVHANDKTELYNLADDIGETKDLASSMPARVKRLTDAWNAWEDDVNKTAEMYQ
jgi:arylsulfatase A